MYIIEVRGTGNSSSSSTNIRWTTSQLAQDIIELYDYLRGSMKWGKFHLVGYSLGGMVAQEIAFALKDRIASLTLESTVAYFNGLPTSKYIDLAYNTVFGKANANPTEFSKALLLESFPKSWLDAPSPENTNFRTKGEWMLDFILTRVEKVGMANSYAINAIQGAIITHNFDIARLNALKGAFPVLVLCGDDDNILIQPSSSKYLADKLGGRLEILKGGRHI
ncbi:hypothetical protein HK096_010204, partial [Nowakowskiella sp. JEL0078]